MREERRKQDIERRKKKEEERRKRREIERKKKLDIEKSKRKEVNMLSFILNTKYQLKVCQKLRYVIVQWPFAHILELCSGSRL